LAVKAFKLKHTILIITLLADAHVWAQPSATPKAFEVASIKPSNAEPGSSGWHSDRGGLLRMNNQTLRSLIVIAYSLYDAQVSGGPKWLATDRFDINAKAEGPTGDSEQPLREMLQSLLADRFKLSFRREKKDMAGYALAVAKGGLKIQPVEADGSRSSGGRGKITAQGASMPKLAELLSRRLSIPVEDATGVAGVFNLTLEWAPEEQGLKATATSTDAPAGPSIFTALQEQLGLKLESRKIPMDVLVIDRAEKPTEN
jgi:uncharacterized protein (TIGR03435 family)